MKRLLIISLVIVILVGACTAILLFNKKRIDAKSKLDGNLAEIPVFVTEVNTSFVGGKFGVNGTFAAIHELILLSETQGKVKELLFRAGDFVEQNQVMARLDDEIVKSQLVFAEAALDKVRADKVKFDGLLRAGGASVQQVEDVRMALLKSETEVTTLRKQLDYATIKAPIQGTVTKRFIEIGSLLLPGTPVAEIVDVSRLKMIANVAESEVVRIRKGMNVNISTSIYPGISYAGIVLSVGVKADEAKRFPVEIELSNSQSNPLKAGMFGTVTFGFEGKREVVMIPRNAIVGSIKTPRVFIVENNKALIRDVILGASGEKEVEVTGGLRKGETIVTSGQINLDDNTTVRIVRNK